MPGESARINGRKGGRPKMFTAEEALERKRARAKEYSRKRYALIRKRKKSEKNQKTC